jgi:HlyD family secretion protein
MPKLKSLALPAVLCGVLLLAAVPRRGSVAIELDGIVRPGRIVHVGSASDGRLEAVLVDRGDFVHAGQLVAELDLSVERAVMALAKARSERTAPVRAAEVELVRIEEKLANHRSLFEEGILTSDDLHDTQIEKQEAELALTDARERLELAALELRHARAVVERGHIRSPIAGAVVDRELSPGELVGRGGTSTVLTIAQLDPLAIVVEVPESELGKVAVGTEVEVRFAEGGTTSRALVVTEVSPVVDEATGTFTVTLALPNPDRRIAASRSCRVRFLR